MNQDDSRSSGRAPRLFDRARETLRLKHYSYRTEQTYLQWIRRYVRYHERRHPREMGEKDIEASLTHLAVDRKVSAATQNQALNALLFFSTNRIPLGFSPADVSPSRTVELLRAPRREPQIGREFS